MVRKLLISSAAAIAFGGFAFGQIAVLGSSLGKDCYTAVLNSQEPTRADERACTTAILSGTMEGRNLTATYINRGIMRMRMGKFDDALADYDVAKQRRPNMGAIYLNEGAVYVSIGDQPRAIEALEKSIALDTQDIHAAYFNLGLAHELNGDPRSAYTNFSKALELKPNWERAEQELERFQVIKAES
ncbi:MAG: tetratricopeptide repeat protein [Pseudomonadota bacterium]